MPSSINIIFKLFNFLAHLTELSKSSDLITDNILAHFIITDYRLIIKLLARGRNRIINIVISVFNA